MNRFNNEFGSLRDGTTTKTFRLRNEYAELLEEEAAKKGVSVSILLDAVLKNSNITKGQIVKSWTNPT